MPFTSWPGMIDAMIVMPSAARAAYSAGPSFSASRASIGATVTSATQATMPPITDETSAQP